MKGRFLVTGILAVTISAGAALRAGPPGLKPRPAPEAHESVYRPTLAVPESMRPFLEHLDPGSDAFALERTARELDARLRLLADALHAGAAGTVATELLDPAFHGARLLPVAAAHRAAGPLDVARATDLPRDLTIDAHAFGAELQRLRADMRDVIVAEFLITAIESDGRPDVPSVRTTVRYDIVGAGTSAFRVEHVGEWELRWRRAAAAWRVVEWRAASDVTSRARVPIFAEITTAALGSIDSFRKQLSIDLDAWMLNRFSVVCLVVGVLLGYASAGSAVKAQSATHTMLPNVVYLPGANLSLTMEAGALTEHVAQINCTVGEVSGDWVRCKAADSFQDEREQRWYDMKRVSQIIIKREK